MSLAVGFNSSYGSCWAVWYVAKLGRPIVQLNSGLERWGWSSLVGCRTVPSRPGRCHNFFSWPLATCINISAQDAYPQLRVTLPATCRKGVLGQPCRC